MAMTLEETRDRVRICNTNIQAEKHGNNWRCANCGVGLTPDKRNKCGWRHYYNSGYEKKCITCDKIKSIDKFYYSHNCIDHRKSQCKECAEKNTANIKKGLRLKGRTRRMWIPDNLWEAINKVKGNLTYRDFIALAVRKEVERRAKDIYHQRIVQAIQTRKSTGVK